MTQEQINPARGPLIPILATVIWLVAAVIAAVPVLMSVMMFDSGTDNVTGWVWMAFYGMWAFLITCVLTVPITWIVWGLTRRHDGGGRLLRVLSALLPLIPLAMVVIGFAGTSAFCDGQLNGC
jgi:small-conductance mechanosensitive channel